MNDSNEQFIKNMSNEFMVLYFKHGYTYLEALEKTAESLEKVFSEVTSERPDWMDDDGSYDESVDNGLAFENTKV